MFEFDQEQLAIARKLRPRTDGFLVDGRPIGAYEMDCLRQLKQFELEQKREQTGCCSDEGPRSDGRCRHGGGKCRLFVEAENLLWRAEHDG